ncbi:MAG: MFS transporter [Spirochaetaceae bacterium]|jgi:MFS family permease|nr:MFS transporter [Spirochaetaceae bacterium]
MKAIGFFGFLGLCFVCFLQGGTAGLSPALQGIADGLGMDVNTVGLIQTVPGIFGVISSIIVGKLAGTKIKYKTIMIGMLVLALIAAIPLVITNWPLMVFSRIILGLSTGVYYALPPMLLMKYFSGDKQRSRLGVANAFASAGGGVMMLVAGLLVVINWKLPFVIFLLPIIPIIFLLIDMPEPAPVPKAEDTTAAKGSSRLGVLIIVNCITGALVFCLGTVALQAISVVVIGRGLGTGAAAGIAAPFFNIGAVILSTLFAVLYKGLKKFLAPITMLVVAGGLFLLYFATNIIMVGAGMFLVGAELIMIPTLITDNGKLSTPLNAGFATALLMALFNCGGFLTGPFMIITSKARNMDVPGPFFAGIILVVLAVITLIIRISQKEPEISTAQ